MNLSPEEREVGRQNYFEAVGVTRRDFLRGVVGAGAVSGAGLGAMYFGYGDQSDPGKGLADPVRVGIIGTGDEGGVLIGALNPKYVQVVAIADIRPYNICRALHGDRASDGSYNARPGLLKIYDWENEEAAERDGLAIYDGDYHKLLEDDRVEAVIIALPLFLHAPVAIEAMRAGKHVLTEKLMAHDIAQCKEMSRVAASTWDSSEGLYLATGHQRHYSVLYDNAVHLLKNSLLGEIQFIRAQWHRGNLPGRDSWKPPLPGGMWAADGSKSDPIAEQLAEMRQRLDEMDKNSREGRGSFNRSEYEKLERRALQWAAWDMDKKLQNSKDKYGMALYETISLSNGYERSAFEELCRWRLWDRTGGGLMAELGSHQLDAASIFVGALHEDLEHVHPLSVYASGGRHTFPMDRDADDHVYCTFEFPAPGYALESGDGRRSIKKFGYYDPVTGYPVESGGIPSYEEDPQKKIIYTYSSIMGNPFGGYGETVMGSKGTMMLAREQEVMLWKAGESPDTRISVKEDKGAATMDAYETGGSGPVAQAAQTGPISRGYTEEIEHWAWCIRNRSPENQPKCHPEIAVADAVLALTAKNAIAASQQTDPKKKAGSFVTFEEDWFKIDSDAVPYGRKPRSAADALDKPYHA